MVLMTDTDILVFAIEVKQIDCTFQFNNYFSEKSCILRGRIDNTSVVSVSILIFQTNINSTSLYFKK